MTYLYYSQQGSLAHAPPQLSFSLFLPMLTGMKVSGIQTEVAFRPVFRCSDRRSFRHSGRRNLWHSGQPLDVQTDINNLISSDVQIEVISSIQTDERHSGHGYFCVTIYFGIQVNILFRYSDWLSPYQTDSSFKTTSLPILTDIVTSLHFSANFWAFIVFNPLIPRKYESSCHLLSGSPVDWIGAAVIPQNLPFIFPGSIRFTPHACIHF